MEETITISRKEYDEMLEEIEELNALREAGVDNWCGIDEAMELLREWHREDVKNTLQGMK
jgi:hypothetical protein